jgi:hypothetical protein
VQYRFGPATIIAEHFNIIASTAKDLLIREPGHENSLGNKSFILSRQLRNGNEQPNQHCCWDCWANIKQPISKQSQAGSSLNSFMRITFEK